MIFRPRKVKRILMVGVMDVPSSTNVAMAKGFEMLGFTIDSYNYRTRANQLGSIFSMWDDFWNFLKGQDYELIVFCKANQMNPELLARAREVAPTWYWFMDPKETATQCGAEVFAGFATYASATSSQVVDMFKLHNEKSYHIIEGYDPETYYYEPMKKKYNIVFVGNATPKRIKSIERIQEVTGKSVAVFGSGWHNEHGSSSIVVSHPPVYLNQEREIYNQAKVVLNLVHDDYIFSDRVVKALGCGALVMSEDCKDLGKMFITMKNGSMTTLVPRFEDVEKFKVLYEMYTEHEVPAGARENVAAFIKKFYSWKASCIKVMDKVGKNYG
jgi:hypothetical protein